jgi:hypothetical protein
MCLRCRASLAKKGEFCRIDSAYLVSLVDNTPTAANVVSYARIVREKAGRRLIFDACRKISDAALDQTTDLEEALHQFVNFTSHYKEGPSEVKFEFNAEALRREAATESGPTLAYLEVLNQERLIVKGWSHLLAGHPKAGKTELLLTSIASWRDEQVLYITEEDIAVWRERLNVLPRIYSVEHVSICDGVMMRPPDILNRIRRGKETVVVLDTIRSLLGFTDETDNSEIARAMMPFISAARQEGKTIIFVHHDRKSGGERGQAISGGHAFMAIVDIALELNIEGPEDSSRRLLRGWGRVIEIPRLLFERLPDRTMIALGSPTEHELNQIVERAWGALGDEWQTTKDLRDRIAGPVPSDNQLLKALNILANDGRAERNPPFTDGKRQGQRYGWRRSQNFTSDHLPYRCEVKLKRTDAWDEVI